MSDAKAIEKANSFRSMMQTWAWKQFEEIMKTERQTALEQAIVSGRMEDVQLYRGIVRCIDSLNSEIESIVNTR